MGNLKTGLWIVIVGFVVLVFFQNQEVFLAKRTLRLDLMFVKYQSPELPDVLLFACTFAIGYLIAYFVNLSSRFKFKKHIKQLTSTLDSQQKELTGLKSEVDGLRAAAAETVKDTEIPLEPPRNEATPSNEETTAEPKDSPDNSQEQKDDEEEKKTDA